MKEKRLKQYTSKELLELITMEGNRCLSKDSSILKEDLKDRGIDLKKILSEEYKKSGKIKKVFQKVRHAATETNKVYYGNLYFTSSHVFYLPAKIEESNRIINRNVHLFGISVNSLLRLLTKKRKAPEKDMLPVSLLVKLIEGGISFKKNEIGKVSFSSFSSFERFNRFLFELTNKKEYRFDARGKDVGKIKKTIKEEGIPLETTIWGDIKNWWKRETRRKRSN